MPKYRCLTCSEPRHEVLPATEGCPYVCSFNRCDGEMERVAVCVECNDSDAMEGLDRCVACTADQIVADPREIENYNDADRLLITRELAARLRVVDLTRKQAA